MAIGTLMGFALRMQGLPADHTYVESSDGHVWPCWGRSVGGSNICVGTGNTAQAFRENGLKPMDRSGAVTHR